MSTLADRDFFQKFSEKYNDVVKLNYKNNSVLKMISFIRDGAISGLNAYSAVLVTNLLEKEKGVRVLYNSGLVLGTEEFPNKYFVKKLTKQIKRREDNSNLKSPLVFKPSDLEIILDKKSPEGIGFKLKENATPVCNPQLKSENNKRKFKSLDERGMPIFDENGSKTLYTRTGGLLKYYQSKSGNFCCWDGLLTNPNNDTNLFVYLD